MLCISHQFFSDDLHILTHFLYANLVSPLTVSLLYRLSYIMIELLVDIFYHNRLFSNTQILDKACVIITDMNKPSLVAIFAHPDDEAFGPAGTIAIYSKTHDVYIICATRGDAGENHSGQEEIDIGEMREQEMRRSADTLGVEDVFFLNYKDATLSNNKYHAIAQDIRDIIDTIKPEILLTYENRGVSGHLDHVAMSLITHYVFHKADYTKKLLSYTILKEQTDQLRDYFIYVPHGYERDNIDLIVDISSVWELKRKALYEHKSQMKDVSRMIGRMEEGQKEEYFLVEEK